MDGVSYSILLIEIMCLSRGLVWEDLLTPVRERPPQAIEGAKQEPLFLTRRWTTAEYAPPEPSQSKSETPSSQETMIELPTTPKRVYKNLEMGGAAPPTPPPTQNKRKREGTSQARGRSTKRARSQTVNSDADNAEVRNSQRSHFFDSGTRLKPELVN